MALNMKPKIECQADKKARRKLLRDEVVKMKLGGKWNAFWISQFKKSHDLEADECKEISKEADILVAELELAAGGIDGVRTELINSFRTVYNEALSRKGVNHLPPDLKSAIAALTGIAKLSGLDIQKHEVVSADITATLQALPIETQRYIALHGEPPPGVSLPGFQPRQLVPSAAESEPESTDNGTALEAEFSTSEKD